MTGIHEQKANPDETTRKLSTKARGNAWGNAGGGATRVFLTCFAQNHLGEMEKDGEEKQMAFTVELLGRRLKRRDAADVRGIIAASKARGDYSMTVSEFYGELHTRGKNAVFAARDSKGRIIGFANATVGPRYGKSWMNQVHPKQRNRGIASALLNEKVRWLLGKGRPVIVTIANKHSDRILTCFTFMGEQFRQTKPDWNTAKDEKRYVLDLRPAIQRRVKLGGLRV